MGHRLDLGTLMPMIVALALVIGAAGRKWGVDAVLARRYPRSILW